MLPSGSIARKALISFGASSGAPCLRPDAGGIGETRKRDADGETAGGRRGSDDKLTAGDGGVHDLVHGWSSRSRLHQRSGAMDRTADADIGAAAADIGEVGVDIGVGRLADVP